MVANSGHPPPNSVHNKTATQPGKSLKLLLPDVILKQNAPNSIAAEAVPQTPLGSFHMAKVGLPLLSTKLNDKPVYIM